MCAFVAEILIAPIGDGRPHLDGLLALIPAVLVMAGGSYMANPRILRHAVLPVAALWLVARVLQAVGDTRHAYTHMAPFLGLIFSCAVLWALLTRFDSMSRVSSSVISEAFISYLVIATAFSQLYLVLDRFLGNPFNQVIPPWQLSTYMYFSMITLTGVGYGGIIPVNPYVRLIAAFENMIGIFYIAVVVARLVASYRSRSRHTGLSSNKPHQSESHSVE